MAFGLTLSIIFIIHSISVLGQHQLEINININTNFIRWKRLDIHADNKSQSPHRFLLTSQNQENDFLLSEVSTVRRCGVDGDDRFPPMGQRVTRKSKPNCPVISSFNDIPNVETCAKKCIQHRQCRSWNYEKVKRFCVIYSQTIRSKYDANFVSGDVDIPLTMMTDALVSSSGTYVCSCNENSIYLYNSVEYEQYKENKIKSPISRSNSPTCIQQQGCRFNKEVKPQMQCSQSHQKSSTSRVIQSLITISQPFGYAHFHFLIENLLRLATIPRELYQRDSMKVQVFNKEAKPSSWQYELLSIFGISKQNVVSGEVFANEVFVPSYTTCGAPSRHQVLSLRSMLLNSPMVNSSNESAQKDSGGGDGIVVVLIERTVSRGLLNMDELRGELTSLSLELGFTLQVYSDHAEATKHNQFTLLSMFSQASIIVAPHGAGLSNMIVSQPCSTIIEARESVHPKCYDHLAQTLGFKYFSGCNFIKRDGVLDNACVSGKGQHVSYQHGLLTAGVNGSIEVNGIGQSLVEVEGGSEGRKKGDNVKVKIAVTQEVSMTVIDIKHTIGLVKREVVWRKEVNSTDANSYSHCIRNAREYYSSFIDSTGVASFDGNKEERDHYSGNVLNWTVPNGPKFAKFLKEKKLN